MFHRVALLTPPFTSLTYARPAWLMQGGVWRKGMRVAVPLGNGACRMGVLLDDGAVDSDLPEGVTARPMVWPLEREPVLSHEHVELARQLALRQLQQPGRIMHTMLPAGLRGLKVKLRVQHADAVKQWSVRQLWELSRGSDPRIHEIAQAWEQGHAGWLLPREDAAASEVCVLLKDPPWAVRPTAVRQRKVLDTLWEQGALNRRQLAQAIDECGPALSSLIKQGLVELRVRSWADGEEGDGEHEKLVVPLEIPDQVTLSKEQQSALDAFCGVLDSGKAASRLLYGITGSGKTLVYLRLAEACLKGGRSMLLLAPEVALALKLRRDVRAVLPEAPLFFTHGYQSPEYRERVFRALAQRTEPCILVGTRSALFMPMPHMGAIVLDEEHDGSFKQDEGLAYQAKEVAWFRASQAGALLVLGSATPDVKTFYAVSRGDIPVDRLPARVGGGTLPDIRMVDIRTADMGESILAPETLTALRATVEKNEQAVIMLNRRGYAPHMYCLDCGTVARCSDCNIALTYHKARERLVCHYCGYATPFPAVCEKCKGLHYLPMGQGTERLEEHIASILPPGGKVLRLDRDSTRRPGRMEEILEAFANKEAHVLVGTQMLSKGHHFPDVTLAVIADGDMGLNFPDYRAAERTFQLLVQSAGRAGRGEKHGQVIIQTRDTDHYCWKFVQNADYDGFYAAEVALREQWRYPPFVRLALIRISFPMQWAQGTEAVAKLGARIRAAGKEQNVTVRGPVPAPLPLLRARKRFNCLLKADDWPAIRQVFAHVAQEATADLRIMLDLDPVNML